MKTSTTTYQKSAKVRFGEFEQFRTEVEHFDLFCTRCCGCPNYRRTVKQAAFDAEKNKLSNGIQVVGVKQKFSALKAKKC